MRPAAQVGGDLIDIKRITADQFGIAIGDISGKGLEAALFSVKLQSTRRALAVESISPGRLISKVNRIFCRDRTRGKFASLIYLSLEKNSGQIQFTNAGHLPPAKISDGKLSMLTGGDAGIGILQETEYTQTDTIFNPEDILVLYSDGLVEARDRNGNFFGEKNLYEVLRSGSARSATELGELVIDRVEKFVNSAPLYNDLSIIILKKIPENGPAYNTSKMK